MFEKLIEQYHSKSRQAHRRGERLKFLSISEADFEKLDKENRQRFIPENIDCQKPRIFGLRILRTEDLETGEFIFH